MGPSASTSTSTNQSPIRLPLSPSKVRFNLPKSTSCSSFPIDLSDNDSTLSDTDSDDRVFFGSPKKGEEELVARLSKAVPATPRSRLKKRDSREFMRRKTILVTPPRRSQPQADGEEGEGSASEDDEKTEKGMKKWPGGFHERRMSDGSDSSSSSSRSVSPTPGLYPETPGVGVNEDHCDLTLDFSRFRVSDSPLSNTRPAPIRRPSLLSGPNLQQEDDKSDAEASGSESEEEDGEEWSETEGEDSDKENAPAPYEHTGEEEDEEKEEYPLFQGPLTGSRVDQEDDILRGLDMGGLTLADFADPQMDFGSILLDTSYQNDFSFSSGEPSEADHGGHTRENTPVKDEQQTVKLLLVAVSPQTAHLVSEPTSQLSPLPPVETSPCPNPSQTSPSPSSSDPDSPLPLSRGGPVIIPTYHSPIRSESSPPFRSFSIREEIEISTPTQFASDTAAPLRFFSPSSPISSPPTEVSTTPTTRPHIAQSATHQAKQPLRSSTLTTSLSTIPPLSASPLPLPIIQSTRALPEEEAVKRSEAIKVTLANVFAGKSLGLGKPQRSVSSTSSQSSVASGSGSGVSRPGSRTGQVGMDGKGKGRLGDSTGSRPVKESRGIPSTSTAVRKRTLPTPTNVAPLASSMTSSTSSRPAVASSGFSRRAPTVPIPTSRPALVPRTLPPLPAPSNRQTTNSQPTRPTVPKPAVNAPAKLAHPPVQAKSRAAQLSHMPIFTCTQPLAVSSPNSMSDSVPSTANPLKRPMSFSNHPTTTLSRSAISTTGRPTLGLPSRVVGDQVFTLSSSRRMPIVSETTVDVDDGPSGFEIMPIFSIGIGGGGGSTRSPGRGLGGAAVKGTPMSVRANRFGTPARLMLGTPSRNLGLGTPSRLNRRPVGPSIQVYSTRPTTATTSVPKDVSSISTSPNSGPPSTNTRHSETIPTSTANRGSSEDHEDVSFALPRASSSEIGSSPIKTPKDSVEPPVDIVNHDLRSHSGRDLHPSKLLNPTSSSPIPSPTNTRPKRTIRPPAPRPIPVPKRLSAAATTLSIAPNLSEKELKAKTSYNTAKNEKYHCAIEKQIVRVGTVRPASPTSTIPTTEQREEEAKKRDREMRIKRRKGGKDVEEDDEDQEILPVVRRLEGGEVDWKGDEEGWDARPAKKQRLGSVDPETKGVKWDKGLVVIRDEGGPYNSGLKKVQGKKSALKSGKQVDLDQHGNILPSRSKEIVKPLKIVVTVRLYEGEEPVVPISQATRGKKKAPG